MKRIVTMALCVCLALGLAAPAMAAESQEVRLQEITLKVKNQLDIDTEVYSEFSGNLYEGYLKNTWSLTWSTPDGRSMTVGAAEDGTILRYYLYSPSDGDPYQSFYGPKYPQDSSAMKAAAQQFLGFVLNAGESVSFQEAKEYYIQGASTKSYYGTIYINNLPSPFSVTVTVRTSDGVVSRYSRTSNEQYTDTIPSASPAATTAQASPLLSGVNTFRLEYVLDDGAAQAVLRYLPDNDESYYVDAQSGKLVNLSELYRTLQASGYQTYAEEYAVVSDAETAPLGSDAGSSSLTETELKGAEQLRDVLSAQTLEKTLRETYPALKLDDFTLGATSFTLTDKKEGTVQARLIFSKKTSDGETMSYYVYMDGKTGALNSVSSYRYSGGTVKSTVSLAEGQATAEAFLKVLDAKASGKVVLESSSAASGNYDTTHSYTLCQKVNGYLFRDNSYTIEVDVETGAVRSLRGAFDHATEFDDPSGIVSEATAQAGYYTAFETTLGYIGVPFSLDPAVPEYQPLIAAGQTYLYNLTLAYTAQGKEGYVAGVDAKTGKAVVVSATEQTPLQYSDVSSHWAKSQIEALAAYQIGYQGGTFQPDKQLTQLDLLALLVSADCRYAYDITDEDQINEIYRSAYSMALITDAQRDQNKVLTRGETIKMILDASGYGKVAQLKGIFTCSFADAGQGGEELLGYLAIAQALGLVSGDTNGNVTPAKTATRADAAVMLHNFMK